MSDFLLLLFSLSLSGALLTGLTACLNRLMTGRMPRSFLYYLWLLALLRFVCPVGAEWSLTHRLVSQLQVGQIKTEAVPDVGAVVLEETPIGEDAVGSVPQSELEKTHALKLSPSALLTAVWAAGALAAFGWRLAGYIRLNRRLWNRRQPVRPWEQTLFQKLTAGERRVPCLFRSTETDTPVLVGVFYPKIYLPPAQILESGLQYALGHELIHWRRYDLLYKWALTLTACVHWFNPAAWYLVRVVDRDCELSCDERATLGLSLEERRDYGNMLLQMAAYQSKISGTLSASLCDAKQSLRERLCEIMKPNLDFKRARVLLVSAISVIAAASITVGAYSVQTAARPGPAPSEAEKTGAAENLAAGLATALTAEEKLAWPFEVEGDIVLSTLYGSRIHPVTGATTDHSGIDIVLEQGIPVLAAASGVVVNAEYSSTNGNFVVVDHGDMSTIYCHLAQWTVEEGETVAAGQQIGTVGRTGMTTGYCLHFEVEVDGARIDPLNCLPATEVYLSSGGKTVPLEF